MTTGFEYIVKRQRRKTIALHILDDAQIEVRAPKWVCNADLVAFVEQNAQWINRRRQEQLLVIAARPTYADGERHTFLGRGLDLRLRPSGKARVFTEGESLVVCCNKPLPEFDVRNAVEKWYRREALEFYKQRLPLLLAGFPLDQLPAYPSPTVKCRKMRKRWGSCSQHGRITLNTQLIKLPESCVDYVIVHELCHLWFLNHGQQFYRLLASVMPDWREREVVIKQLENTLPI